MQVYLITNLVNGKYYVGKTVSENLNRYLSVKRWAARHGHMQCMPIVAAMAKHGISNFSTQVLAHASTAEQLSELERLWIVALDSRNPQMGYNLSAGGEGARRPCSVETKRKIGLANKGRKPLGYVRTIEHRKQLHERMQGNRHGKGHARGYRPSEASRAKQRAFALEQWRLRREGA